MHAHAVDRTIAAACWLYAILWLAVSLDPSGVLGVIVEPPPVGVKYIPAALAGAFLFAAAPFMRNQERKMGWVYGIGTVTLLARGLWSAVQGQVGIGEGSLWIGIPLAIAAWVVAGTYNRQRPPDEIASQVLERATPPLAVVLILGTVIVLLGMVAIVSFFMKPFP